jgi:glutamate/tyrosine decarboxylase-like PLP-dependent enzyme
LDRQALENATVYFSDQAHSSLEKALRVIGLRFGITKAQAAFGRFDFRMPIGELVRQRIEQDRSGG